MENMTQAEVARWIARHDTAHSFLVSRELYERDRTEFREDLDRLNRNVARATWALVTLVFAVGANMLIYVLTQVPG